MVLKSLLRNAKIVMKIPNLEERHFKTQCMTKSVINFALEF